MSVIKVKVNDKNNEEDKQKNNDIILKWKINLDSNKNN